MGFKDVEAGYSAFQVRDEPLTGEWDGACYQCCGQCDETGWSIFSTTWAVPCVAYGFNTKRAFGTFWKGFFVVAWLMSAVVLYDGYNRGCMTMARLNSSSDEEFGEGVAECFTSPGYMVFALLFLFTCVATVVYLARNRTEIRNKLGIKGSFLQDCCLWLWCHPCAMCQEGRTLRARNVVDGVVYGGQYTAVAPTLLPPTMPAMH